MALLAKQNGSSIEPIPAGTYQAVCCAVVDLGTQHTEFAGKPKKSHKIAISWEIPDVRIDFEKDGKQINAPRMITKQYTLSLGDKSSLYKDLISWRGRAFTAKELDGFDLFTILGANCILQLIHAEKNGKTYCNIASISSLMKNMPRKNAETPTVYYSMTDHQMNIPAGIPDWIRDIIQKSDEFLAVEHAKGVFANDDTGSEEAPTMNDDIPF